MDLSLHYRAVPGDGPALGAAMAALVEGSDRFVILPARKAWELRPHGADKGTAVDGADAARAVCRAAAGVHWRRRDR